VSGAGYSRCEPSGKVTTGMITPQDYTTKSTHALPVRELLTFSSWRCLMGSFNQEIVLAFLHLLLMHLIKT
jgi:hypothetical protein